MNPREAARAVFDSALAAGDVRPLVLRALADAPLPPDARVLAVGAGKASGAMAAAAEEALGIESRAVDLLPFDADGVALLDRIDGLVVDTLVMLASAELRMGRMPAAATLRALSDRLSPSAERDRARARWRETVEDNVARWWRVLGEQARVEAEPVNPMLVFHELSPLLPDNAVVTADSGSATNWWARHLRLREGMDAALSGTLATMCPAVPYALAARLAFPDRPVIASIGDGAMQMLGINGLIDIVAHAGGPGPPLVVLVLNNGDLNQVTWEQRVLAGDAKLEASQDLPHRRRDRHCARPRLGVFQHKNAPV